MNTVVHVNRNILASNKKYGKNDPAIIIRCGKKREYCYKAQLDKNTIIIHDEKNPLDCGARCYIICSGQVKILE
jgi:Glu-tRNA(Gln) amidotransferase subunit E-like FAD-binding protein